jgi:hypothetical protein
MPAYLGRAERTIALGREQELVSMTVHPAGVLSIFPIIEGDKRGLRGFRLEPEERGGLIIELDEPEDPRSLILRTGRYDAFVVERADTELMRVIAPGRGIYVAPEIESLTRLRFKEKEPPLLPGDPTSLVIDTGGDVITELGVPRTIAISIEAKNGAGESVVVPTAIVHVTISADPFTALVTAASSDASGLPARIPNVSFTGLGRAIVRARAELTSGRTIRGAAAVNILPRSVTPGSAQRIVLSIEDPTMLEEGTQLDVDLLDARGLFASEQTGKLDLSASDPWAFFPAGPLSAIVKTDHGHIRRDLSRPSGPRGLPVVVRATLTSTAPMLTLSSSVALPLLEIR